MNRFLFEFWIIIKVFQTIRTLELLEKKTNHVLKIIEPWYQTLDVFILLYQ